MATFHSQGDREIDYSAKGYTPQQIEVMRRAERFNATTTLGLSFTKSFKNYPCHNFDYYATLYSQYDKHGTLPFAGPLVDQPAIIIDIFNVLRSLVIEAEDKERKRLESKRKK